MAVKIYGDGSVSENLNADKVDSQESSQLLDRSNHTGVAPQSSVEELETDLADAKAASEEAKNLSIAYAIALG